MCHPAPNCTKAKIKLSQKLIMNLNTQLAQASSIGVPGHRRYSANCPLSGGTPPARKSNLIFTEQYENLKDFVNRVGIFLWKSFLLYLKNSPQCGISILIYFVIANCAHYVPMGPYSHLTHDILSFYQSTLTHI